MRGVLLSNFTHSVKQHLTRNLIFSEIMRSENSSFTNGENLSALQGFSSDSCFSLWSVAFLQPPILLLSINSGNMLLSVLCKNGLSSCFYKTLFSRQQRIIKVISDILTPYTICLCTFQLAHFLCKICMVVII